MEYEQHEYIVSQAQSEMIEKFTGTCFPTHAEILVARGGILTPEAIEELQKNGCRVDMDTVAVMMNIYEDRLKDEVPDQKATLIYATLATGALLSSGMGIAAAMNGNTNEAYTAWYTASGMGAAAYALNAMDEKIHARRVEQFLENHWPPVYSPAALEKAKQEAFLQGKREQSQARVQRNVLQQVRALHSSIEDITIEKSIQEVSYFLVINSIMEKAQSRFLTEQELQVLKSGVGDITPEKVDLYHINMGVPNFEFMKLLVNEYEQGVYPVGFIVDSIQPSSDQPEYPVIAMQEPNPFALPAVMQWRQSLNNLVSVVRRSDMSHQD